MNSPDIEFGDFVFCFYFKLFNHVLTTIGVVLNEVKLVVEASLQSDWPHHFLLTDWKHLVILRAWWWLSRLHKYVQLVKALNHNCWTFGLILLIESQICDDLDLDGTGKQLSKSFFVSLFTEPLLCETVIAQISIKLLQKYLFGRESSKNDSIRLSWSIFGHVLS